MDIKEPTGDQCNKKIKVFEDANCTGYALWYPQMGGYSGKAVALFDKTWEESEGFNVGGCIDVLVWHDGDFPFGDKDQKPRELHHCDPEQFIEFGKILMEINEKGRKEINP